MLVSCFFACRVCLIVFILLSLSLQSFFSPLFFNSVLVYIKHYITVVVSVYVPRLWSHCLLPGSTSLSSFMFVIMFRPHFLLDSDRPSPPSLLDPTCLTLLWYTNSPELSPL